MTATLVRSVLRALNLLHVLGAHRGYMPLGETANAANLPKSTAHGLLQTLVSENLVEHDPACGSYRLSPSFALGLGHRKDTR